VCLKYTENATTIARRVHKRLLLSQSYETIGVSCVPQNYKSSICSLPSSQYVNIGSP